MPTARANNYGQFVRVVDANGEGVRARLDVLGKLHSNAVASANAYSKELDIARRIAADRERRLVVALHDAEQAVKAATARAEAEASTALEAERRAEDHRRHAEWAADERARLARCYESACQQAAAIGATLTSTESEIGATLAARDSEIDALRRRCAELERTLLEHIGHAIADVRAERDRLSAMVSEVQRGRFWALKHAVARFCKR